MLPVRSVKEADVPSPAPRPESLAGCFSCGELSSALFWMSRFRSCHRGGGRTELMTNSYYHRAQRASLPAAGKRQLIRGGGLVTRISNDYEPQLPVVAEDVPWPAARDVVASQVGAVRPLEKVDQRTLSVGDGFRLLCDDSDDDVLSVGPIRPLLTAASLSGVRMDDDCRLQVDSLNDELSVEAWAAENHHETCCAQLDHFDWVIPPYDLDMI